MESPQEGGDIVNAALSELDALVWSTLGKTKFLVFADHEYHSSQ
jgi:hypothetical protein